MSKSATKSPVSSDRLSTVESEWEAEAVEVKKVKKAPERNLLGMVKRTFDKAGAFFYKIPDMPHFEGSGVRFDREKPFDAFALADGVPVAIEAKWLPKSKALSLAAIRRCQEVGLDDWFKSGGVSVLLVGIGRGKETRLVVLNWVEVRDGLKSGRSIKKCELENLPMIRVSKGEFPKELVTTIANMSCSRRD